jgi:hypothetical protein
LLERREIQLRIEAGRLKRLMAQHIGYRLEAGTLANHLSSRTVAQRVRADLQLGRKSGPSAGAANQPADTART